MSSPLVASSASGVVAGVSASLAAVSASPPAAAAVSPEADAEMDSPQGPDEDDEAEAAVSTSAWTARKKGFAGPAATPLPATTVWSALDLPAQRRAMCDGASAHRLAQQVVKEGDSVIAYESRISMNPLVLKKGAVLGNRFGNFHHNDMIGLKLGGRVAARGKQHKGWIVLLPFAPDLWTNSLTHRTQILYQADIAYILFALDLKPGDVVFESGTGSGSLTTALATTIAPHGHVHTFEFNADRVQKARVDFANNKLSSLITVRERNVVENGFPMVEGGCNAVFLDLPAPWAVVESSHNALKHGGRVCSFSPCIEQVQRTCLEMDRLGFSEISTVEILLRSFEVQSHQTFTTPKFPQQQPRRERNFNATGAAAGAAVTGAAPTAATPATTTTTTGSESRKRPLEETVGAAPSDATEAADAAPEKKAKLEDGTALATPAAAEVAPPAAAAPTPTPTPAVAKVQPPLTLVTTKPYQLMRGHTGYLTFAVCNKF